MRDIVIKIDNFMGLDNKRRPDRVGKNFFQGFENVDVDNEGSVRLRPGKERVYTGAVTQVMSDGVDVLFVSGGVLYRLGKGGSKTALKTLNGTGRFATTVLNNQLYFASDTDSGIYAHGALRDFGVEPPPIPVCADAVGTMTTGRYLVSLTYLRSDGQESGASDPVAVACSSGGISVSGLVASQCSDVSGIVFYVSSPDGETLWRQFILDEYDDFVIRGGLRLDGHELATRDMAPMPSGDVMFFHRGRLYVGRGNTLVYSQPWSYELTNLDHNYFPFDANVTVGMSVEGGVWVGTENNTYFLQGEDPEAEGGMPIRARVGSGAIRSLGAVVDYTSVPVAKFQAGKVAVWGSPNGIYAGDGGGNFVDITGAYFSPTTTHGVASCFYEGDKADQFYFSVSSRNNSGEGQVSISGSGTGVTG